MADSMEKDEVIEDAILDELNTTLDEHTRINIGLIGPVSVGKTTMINALFTNTYGNTALKRSTLCPQLYHETLKENDLCNDPKKIYELNEQNYQELSSKPEITKDDITALDYFVPKIQKFVKLPKNIYYTVHDIPGLNDGHDKDIYFDYVRDNFQNYDIITYIIDVNSKFESTDDFSILNMIISQFQLSKEKLLNQKLIIVVNKCDDMEDKKTLKCYEKIKATLDKKLEHTNIDYDILHMSCETAYLYRMIKNRPDVLLEDKYYLKIGLNQYGKAVWKKLDQRQRIDRVKYDLNNGNIIVLESGFEKFIECVDSFLYGPDGQKSNSHLYIILENKIRYEWINQFEVFNTFMTQKESDTDSIGTYIPEFLSRYAKRIKAISTYLEYLEKYFIMVRDNCFAMTENTCSNKSYNDLHVIDKHLKKILSDVQENIPFISDEPFKSIIHTIQNKIVEICDGLLGSTIKISEAKFYMNFLCKHSYPKIYECMITFFKNVISKCKLDNRNQYIDFLNHCLESYELEQEQVINILLEVLPMIYQKIYRGSESKDSQMNGILSLIYEYLPEIHGKTDQHIKYRNLRIYVRMLISRVQQMSGPDPDFDEYQKWINLARDNYNLQLESKLVHLLTNIK